MAEPALLALELDSIARGFETTDALLKEAPVRLLAATPSTPGRFLVVAAGEVADAEYAFRKGLETADASVVDSLLLTVVDPQLVPALEGVVAPATPLAIGVVEATTAVGAILAADAIGKETRVSVMRVHVSHGLAGKGFVIVAGEVADVTQAAETATDRLASRSGCVGTAILANPDAALIERVYAGEWGSLLGSRLY